jgi:spore maturation protein CgeB
LNGDLNLRVFEVISSGGFLLTDRLAPQSGIDLLFEDGKHFVSFSNIDDLTEKIRYFLQHPEEAFAIARNGCQHYWENYAPEKNIARLMHYLETGEIEDIYRAEYEPRCFA